MRRMLALLTAFTVAAALAPLLAGGALAETASVSIAPEIEGNTAVRAMQRVVVSGQAPAGATITDVRAVGHQADGQTTAQVFGSSVRNRNPAQAGNADYIYNDGGQLTGRLTLNCIFNDPDRTFCLLDRGFITELAVVVTLSTGGDAVSSNRLRVDFTLPVIDRYELVAEDRIKVWFSEPVRHRLGDHPLDWEIREPIARVLSVQGPTESDCDAIDWPHQPRTGCSRTLVITPVDEDDEPLVEHTLARIEDYEDYASNTFTRDHRWDGQSYLSRAADLIRPPQPSIDLVNGEPHLTSSEFDADGDRSPTLQVSNIRSGHEVYFRWSGSEGTKGETEPETVSEAPHTTTLPELGVDDEFTIEAVAVDVNGNESSEADKNRPVARPDSGRHIVRYVLVEVIEVLPVPRVTQPASELYTSQTGVTVAGVVEPAREGVAVTIRDRDTMQILTTVQSDANGAWSTGASMNLERRHRFQVRTELGDQSSEWVPVPPVILDQTNPTVHVARPAPQPGVTLQSDGTSGQVVDTRARHYEGDAVDITWLAADPALLDLENPDHGSHVDIEVVFSDGARRDVVEGLDYTLGTQTHGYTVRAQDVTGPQREAEFDVTVTDLAGNTASATSHPIVIDGTLLGYSPVFVQNDPQGGVIEARFPVALEGTTSPADWRIDGVPVRSASQPQSAGSGSIVTLVTTQPMPDPNLDPSDPPMIEFTPPPLSADRLRGTDGRDIATTERPVQDGIPPALSISLPDPGPLHAETVMVTGQTDQTDHPNTVRAYRDGTAVGQTTAGTNGQFSLTVPLDPDRVNHIEVRAIDPSSNVSPTRAFDVIEDSTPPVVVIDHPTSNSAIARNLDIRWTTIDDNPDVVDIDYRVGTGDWQNLVTGLPDDGRHRWSIPASIPEHSVLALRITATDKAGHRGQASIARTLSLSLRSLVDEHCDPAPPAPFVDRDRIPEVHRTNVDCLYALGITKGVPRDGELWFLPHDDISRAQFAGFTYRTTQLLGVELPGPAERFEDVPAGHTFDTDIHRLAAAAVVEGYDGSRFGPLDAIKRDQTASLLLRTWEYSWGETLSPTGSGYFADTGASFHRENIDAAYEAGLVEGRVAPRDGVPGTYEPASHTSRAQMATVLVRYLRQF